MLETKSLKGKRFGLLTVTGFAGYIPSSVGGHRKAMWRCRCDCGNIVTTFAMNLNSGRKKSCGCLKQDYLKGRWFRELSNRTLCDEWNDLNMFKIFMICAGYEPGKRIKRLDVSKKLSPSNFCFV